MLAGLLALSGCIKDPLCIRGEGPVVTEILTLDEIRSLNLQSSFDVYVKYGPEQEVKAIGHSNIIEQLETTVVGKHWNISLGQGCFYRFDLEIHITLPLVEALKNTGSGDLIADDLTGTTEMEIRIDGSGDIEMKGVNGTEKVFYYNQGSGSFTGLKSFEELKELTVRNSGSGRFYGFALQSDVCEVSVSGSGSAEVYARDKLEVSISGSGNVYYKGSPEIALHQSGSGRLISRN